MAALHATLRVVSVAGVAALLGIACGDDDEPLEPTPPPPEQTTLKIAGLPVAWQGGAAQDYELGRDALVARSGRASGYLRSTTTSPHESFGAVLQQMMSADAIRGQRVRLSGYVRVESVTGLGAALWLKVDDKIRSRAFDNMSHRRHVGTQDWTYAEVVLDVPNDAIGVTLGAMFAGVGTAWFDDLRIDVVGNTVPVTAPASEGELHFDADFVRDFYEFSGPTPLNLGFEGFPQAESEPASIDWLRSNSITFESEAPASPDADLSPLGAMIGGARVVAMGEGTHGTRQFFRMKHKVFQYLVTHHGFDTFSIEAALPEALAVDRYVQTGAGDPEDAIRGMRFWTWSTEEVLDLVQWMRSWNASGGQPRVRFTGFDMQFTTVAIDSVVRFARSLSEALGDTVRTAYSCLDPARDSTGQHKVDRYRAIAAATQLACSASIAGVDSLFSRRFADWSQRAGSDRTTLMQRLARVVSQWEDNARRFGATRDRYMAENAEWWSTSSSGTMLWAHNGHVRREPGWMGWYLDERLGTDYFNVGFTFSSGLLTAVLELSYGVYGAITSHQVGGAWPGSIEALFDATGHPRAIFDTRKLLTGGPVAPSLQRRLTMRSVGATFSRTANLGVYQYLVTLPREYDVIIWFQSAGPSQLLRD